MTQRMTLLLTANVTCQRDLANPGWYYYCDDLTLIIDANQCHDDYWQCVND